MAAKVLRPLMTLIFACLVTVASLGVAGAAVTTTSSTLGVAETSICSTREMDSTQTRA